MLDDQFDPFDPAHFAFLRKWFRNANFDPITATAMAATAAGGGLSAMGTLAGGNAAKQAGLLTQQADEFKAQQLTENSAGAIAAAGRTAIDTNLKGASAISTLRARGAANGINVAAGSPASDAGAIASRTRYQAGLDLFNGENKATADLNEAAAARYSGAAAAYGGEEAQSASELAAAGTFASSFGSMAKIYGKLN